jgi:hypothetical protein
MATGYGTNAKGILDNADPGKKVSGAKWGANKQVFREVLDLSNANVARADGDVNLLFRKPAGTIVDKITVVSSVSLTTSQLAFGIAGAATKYGAAKAYGTTAKAVQVWAEPTAMDDDESTAEEVVMVTVSTAGLPSSGIVVIDMEVLAKG